MYFEDALRQLRESDHDKSCIRRKSWDAKMEIRWMPDRLYSSHLAMFDGFTAIPWTPTHIDICMVDDWEFKESMDRDELCKKTSEVKKQIRKMQKDSQQKLPL